MKSIASKLYEILSQIGGVQNTRLNSCFVVFTQMKSCLIQNAKYKMLWMYLSLVQDLLVFSWSYCFSCLYWKWYNWHILLLHINTFTIIKIFYPEILSTRSVWWNTRKLPYLVLLLKIVFRIVVVNNGCNAICVTRFLSCICSGVQQPAVYLPAPSVPLWTVHQRGVHVHPTALGLRQGPGLWAGQRRAQLWSVINW